MGKVQSAKQVREKKNFKGYAPMKHDRFIYWLIKMIVQVGLFYLIYAYTIVNLRKIWGDEYIIEIFYRISLHEVIYVIFLLITTDLAVHLAALGVIVLYDYKKDYMRNKKSKKQLTRRMWEYIFYIVFRAFLFIIGFVWTLTYLLYPVFYWTSFMLAWILISIITKLSAKLLAIKMSI